jgi:anaerobic ribonucleoside-triphosphate reductase
MDIRTEERYDDDFNQCNLFIMKRSGERVPFNESKIVRAIEKANAEVTIPLEKMSAEKIAEIAAQIRRDAENAGRDLSVEEIQDKVEDSLMIAGYCTLARLYITYRYKHNLDRKKSTLDKKIESLINVKVNKDGSVSGGNEEVNQENSNKDTKVLSVQRDYMAGEWSREYTNRNLLPEDVVNAHRSGLIHVHDTDYMAQPEHNCCLINLEDMLQNETCISGTKIERPKSFMTASTVASQIIAQVASSQYGGQTISLAHLAPFVDISRQKILKRLSKEMSDIGIEVTEEKLKELAEKEVRKEVENGCQTLQYQLITLQTTNGQAPFVTVFMYLNEAKNEREKEDLALLIEVMFKQRMLGVKDSSGYYITPAFPKLIYCLQEDNISEDGKYWYLTELAAKCTAKRMVPDYISEKKMLELKGDVYPSMGCRSFLTPDRCSEKVGNIAHALNYEEGKHKYYGRFNQGVVTINLVDVACSSEGDEDKFWEILEERLNLCHKALRAKHERLLGTPSDVAPIQWQHGALARLKPGEVIDPLLFNGYSTISLGYAGLAECVYFMKHVSHTSENGKEFGLKVMQALNDACGKWKAEENIDYSVYGTPLESTTYKFAKCLQKRFGKIPGVTDKNYITNSYHIRVTENINAFDKLTKEAEFQKLSPGGAISYVEVPNMQGNIPAVLAIIKHIYNTILYAELNTKSDQCEACGYNGEIQIVNKDGKLIWRCPQCGCTDQNKMHVARRTCGYIGTQYWNQGRTQEIAERVLHVSVDEDETEKKPIKILPKSVVA